MNHRHGRILRGLLLAAAVTATLAAIAVASEDDREDRNLIEQGRRTLRLVEQGKRTFRFDTFGDEAYWGGQLRLHEAIQGAALGGVGPGVSPATALAVGLKVDVDALPPLLIQQVRQNLVNLNDPAVTLALLKLNAVVGVTGFFRPDGSLRSMGIQCALCHSTVDNSFAPGIGRRLDGWANRDLNVGLIVSLAPNLNPIADLLQVTVDTVKTVLLSWGPGKFDAELILDGKAFRPDGKPAATLIPPAYGLAGINLHTWTGWGSVPYWNAFVANLEMHGKGRFFDPRLNNPAQFPVVPRTDFANHNRDLDPADDRITPKLAGLHLYQLSLAAPRPPAGMVDREAAERGRKLFDGKARCNTCHVRPLFVEPGWSLHKPSEVCVDDFQANRAPDKMYRTAPLKGLFAHQKGGFYHDGRFPTLLAVIDHYNDKSCMNLGLNRPEEDDLIQYLLSR